jgi:diguanylate cyclase (GGDEF)-like protein
MTALADAIASIAAAVDDLQLAAMLDDKTPLQNGTAWSTKLKTLNQEAGQFAVIFGDVNGFKAVNTQHTYRGGDAAIHAVGAAIADALDPIADAVGYRQSGDEFSAVAPLGLMPEIADALRNACTRVDVTSHGAPFFVSVSFGWAYADPEQDTHTWQARAEEACKRAKQRGPGTVEGWTDAMTADVDTFRCRCACGCAYAVELPAGTATLSSLCCPRCGASATGR